MQLMGPEGVEAMEISTLRFTVTLVGESQRR